MVSGGFNSLLCSLDRLGEPAVFGIGRCQRAEESWASAAGDSLGLLRQLNRLRAVSKIVVWGRSKYPSEVAHRVTVVRFNRQYLLPFFDAFSGTALLDQNRSNDVMYLNIIRL